MRQVAVAVARHRLRRRREGWDSAVVVVVSREKDREGRSMQQTGCGREMRGRKKRNSRSS
jgi:hypothetical protein